ncbi:unnamed protein product [Blumeria hordei]|uniref:Uncharacterized protein n=2 Tax=Blumeria hordei TaxID=2867405 RepID=A0A383UIC2_BLUHO|nr:putative effector protein [Blumeria hordei DH14]SZE99310.1 unnamed protein product [Blumeria hordei]
MQLFRIISILLAFGLLVISTRPCRASYTKTRTSADRVVYIIERTHSDINLSISVKDINGTHIMEQNIVEITESSILRLEILANVTNVTTIIMTPVIDNGEGERDRLSGN